MDTQVGVRKRWGGTRRRLYQERVMLFKRLDGMEVFQTRARGEERKEEPICK